MINSKKKCEEQIKNLKHLIKEQQELLKMYENVYQELNKTRYDFYTTTDIAKKYKCSAKKLNKFLAAKGVLEYVASGRYQLTESFRNNDYQVDDSLIGETYNSKYTFYYWTEKGKKFIEGFIAFYWSDFCEYIGFNG